MSSRWRRVGVAIVIVLGVAAFSCAVFAAWLPSEGGRRLVARQLEQIISDQIPGSLRVGAIDAITPEGLRARDVVFMDAEGVTVISVDHVEMAVDYLALTRGSFVSPRSVARGGLVMLTTDADGELRIDRAFEGQPGGGGPTGRDIALLQNLVARDVEVRIEMRDAPRTRVRARSAVLQIRVPEGSGTLLGVHGIRARARIEAPAPIELRITGGTLSLDSDARQRARLVLPSHVGDAAMDVEIDVISQADESMRVNVLLRPHGIGAFLGSIATIGQTLIAEIGNDAFDVTVEID